MKLTQQNAAMQNIYAYCIEQTWKSPPAVIPLFPPVEQTWEPSEHSNVTDNSLVCSAMQRKED